jgi:hypothetical protein
MEHLMEHRTTANHTLRLLGVNQQTLVLHVPKAAGSSLFADLRKLVGSAAGRERCRDKQHQHAYCECCFRRMQKPGAFHITMFRSPRAHILSQFMMSANSSWGSKITDRYAKANPLAPRMPAIGADGDWRRPFVAWLRHFARWRAGSGRAELQWTPAKSGGDFDVYNPISLQARQLSCDGHGNAAKHLDYVGNVAHHATSSAPPYYGADLALALASLDALESVGVVELYHESVCLMGFQLRHSLSKGCACDERTSEAKSAHHYSHGVISHDARSFAETDEASALMDALAAVDAHVYREALRRVLTGLKHVEGATGKPLLRCVDWDKLSTHTHYLYGNGSLSEARWKREGRHVRWP